MDAVKEKRVYDVFNIDNLYNHQRKSLTAVTEKKDVFLSTKTTTPLVFDDDNSVIVVISPLVPIMKEQVIFLNAMGFSATYIGRDKKENVGIEDGKFTFVFSSPEILLGDQKWRNVMLSNRPKLRLIVSDGADTMLQWCIVDYISFYLVDLLSKCSFLLLPGESHMVLKSLLENGLHMGEVRSLCPGTPLMVLTARAGPKNREKIYRKLYLVNPLEIVENIDRPKH
ncbi:hypothetical protein KUTeg_012719 [Tegillarca granosa]|uniref:Helicase ATP-binding domain-containing protein n=1 Tax=Tegillarca granosa TaxID=220873 RepID=A0ABQ9F0B3_TEGGR|nr:hypothetical protein KUTeg_012719 [Tegillarca granosa]